MVAGQNRTMPILGVDPPRGPPSIFNDVIGPVMRGPSSSHCAAAVRIGRLARDLMGGMLRSVLVEFHPQGSLATTHETQGSDMGLFGGLLGWDAADERLTASAEALREAGIHVKIRIADFFATHPNTYRLTLEAQDSRHAMVVLSTGGGAIRIVDIDGIPLSLDGDRFSSLVFLEGKSTDSVGSQIAQVEEEVRRATEADDLLLHSSDNGHILQIDCQSPPSHDELRQLLSPLRPQEIRTLEPVLPIRSRPGMTVPFLSATGMADFLTGRDAGSLWELAVTYETARGGISDAQVMDRMEGIVRTMEASVEEGLAGTEYDDRILPPQTGLFGDRLESGQLLDAGLLNRMILYVSAIMEVKSSMGVVVAAPTAGSCGALPGAVLAAGHAMNLDRREMARAMLAAGLVGVFISAGSTFAAEECGCQAECGAGSGMAAAALVTLSGGAAETALAAASMAMQNTLGMICDPVANRVEVPCLGRNVLAAANALASANLALAGFDPVIPLDQVISTMDQVGKALPRQLRCTALGGLSTTEASERIQEELKTRHLQSEQ